MDKKSIISYFENNGIEDHEEIKYKDDLLVLRLYYDFDEEELKAAKAYSNDECTEEAEGEVWYSEYFLPYLSEIAVDNVGEVIEELMEASHVQAQYVTYDVDKEEHDYCEFIVVIGEENQEFEIEDVLDELEM